ncbi:MAG: transposase [Actinomycetota bacterium]|nr:transposase [Actinomycetota bacterium]
MSESRKQPVSHPAQKRYPPEMKERAIRLVSETIAETGEAHGVVGRIARQLGVGVETLRYWVKQADIDGGLRPGVSSEEKRRIVELERENRELRRANEILRTASAFFAAAELDRRLR